MIPFWLRSLIWTTHNNERVEMWWIRLRLEVLESKEDDGEGIITNVRESMRTGSVKWELTVGASGGQPQMYTSLCLFKLNVFFSFVSLHRNYSIHTVQDPLNHHCVPSRGEENREVAWASYTNIQYLINTGGDSHSNTHIHIHTLPHKWRDRHIRVNASQHRLNNVQGTSSF